MKLIETNTMSGPREWFTGQVTVEMLFRPITPEGRTGGAQVTFEPGARTAWHTHPVGQTLIITSGIGWIQVEGGEKQEVHEGDVVQFAPDEKHWHGATESSQMSHIALQESKDGKNVDWMEHVSDADYRD